MSFLARALATVAVLTLCGVWSEAAMAGVSVNRLADWDLERLGAGSVDLATERSQAESSLQFSLPRSARQGPDRWYLVRLHFEVELAADSGPGSVFVTASTNGRAGHMVELDVLRRPGSPPRIRWNSLDLVRGPASGVARGGRVELDVENFLQDAGVRPGENTLTFDVERRGRVKLERVRVLGDSGIRVSDKSPAHLVLTTSLPTRAVAAGEWFEIGYELHNDGDRPAHGITIGIEPSSPSLVVSHTRHHTQPMLQPGERLTGSFRVGARRAGDFRVDLAAAAKNANRPLHEIAVSLGAPVVAPAPSSADVSGSVVFGLFALSGMAAAAAIVLRRRRRQLYSG